VIRTRCTVPEDLVPVPSNGLDGRLHLIIPVGVDQEDRRTRHAFLKQGSPGPIKRVKHVLAVLSTTKAHVLILRLSEQLAIDEVCNVNGRASVPTDLFPHVVEHTTTS